MDTPVNYLNFNHTQSTHNEHQEHKSKSRTNSYLYSYQNQPTYFDNNQITNNKKKSENTPFDTFLLGLVVGTIHVIVGHPLETVKTRLQTQSSHALFRNIWSGVVPPLMAVPLSWSMFWLVYSKTKNTITNSSHFSAINHHNFILNYMTIFACGAMSGILPCLLICPTELIKCYAQKYHLSSWNASKSIYNKFFWSKSDVIMTSERQTRTPLHIFIKKGIFRGFVSNLVRDCIGMGMYFTCFEFCRNNIKGYHDHLSIQFLSGTLNGIAYLLLAFPGDCIKSKVQTDFVLANNIDQLNSSSFITNARAHVSRYGIQGLYKGFVVMMIRAPIVSGTAVVGLETAQKYLDAYKFNQNS